MPTEEQALEALREIERVLQRRVIRSDASDGEMVSPVTGLPDHGLLCYDYDQIRPKLDAALIQIDALPSYGRYIGIVIRFLMQVADRHCPAGE
jgi:hypothetical protein